MNSSGLLFVIMKLSYLSPLHDPLTPCRELSTGSAVYGSTENPNTPKVIGGEEHGLG